MNNCPFSNCPFVNNMMRDFNAEEDYFDGARASWREVNRIFSMLSRQRPDLFRNLQRYGVNRGAINNYFRTLISFTLDNAGRYPGNIYQKTEALYSNFRRRYSWIFGSLRRERVPEYVIDNTFKAVIEFTLRRMSYMPGPGQGPGPSQGPGPGPGQGPGPGPGQGPR
ncbi:MAG: hypothetical protein ACM3X7_04980 [Solirubrobacterales bacterium]